MIAAFFVVLIVVFLLLLKAAWIVAVVGAFFGLALTVALYLYTYSELKHLMGEEYWVWALIGSLALGTLILKFLVTVVTKVSSSSKSK